MSAKGQMEPASASKPKAATRCRQAYREEMRAYVRSRTERVGRLQIVHRPRARGTPLSRCNQCAQGSGERAPAKTENPESHRVLMACQPGHGPASAGSGSWIPGSYNGSGESAPPAPFHGVVRHPGHFDGLPRCPGASRRRQRDARFALPQPGRMRSLLLLAAERRSHATIRFASLSR
jgi:hypothetical protein